MASDKHLPKWLRGFTPGERAQRKAFLKASIRQMRRFAHGFDASDGYDLSRLLDIHPSKVNKVLRLSARINEMRASPHVEKVAHSKSDRRALKKRTRQDFIPQQKRWVVHVADPKRTKVVIERGHVIEEAAYEGARLRQQFFPLSEQAVSFDHLADIVQEMLPGLPEGTYWLETASHGAVKLDSPMYKNQLVNEIRRFWTAYDVGDPRMLANRSSRFAPSITGLRLSSTTVEGVDVAALRAVRKMDLYRDHYAEQKRREFGVVSERLKPVDKSGKLTGRRGRVK